MGLRTRHIECYDGAAKLVVQVFPAHARLPSASDQA